jgi:hypothetical protein
MRDYDHATERDQNVTWDANDQPENIPLLFEGQTEQPSDITTQPYFYNLDNDSWVAIDVTRG